MRLVFATGNAHKMEEIREILEGIIPADTEILSMKEAGAVAEPEENGESFAENARIKARAVAEVLHEKALADGVIAEGGFLPEDVIVLADDSGLCIDYLDGAPGIYSARFMGHDTSYEEKNLAIIEKLKGVEGSARSARFSCAVCAVLPDGEDITVTEHMEGEIAHAPAGCGGFGYDPIFYLPEYGCTDAELPPGGKNKISHRGKAIRGTVAALQERKVLPTA